MLYAFFWFYAAVRPRPPGLGLPSKRKGKSIFTFSHTLKKRSGSGLALKEYLL
jgi:hypothetical protein